MKGSLDPISSALEAVLHRFKGMVRAVGARYGLDDRDLDEMMQDVRIRLWRARENGTIGDAASSYVYQTARSAALDLVRKRHLPKEIAVQANVTDVSNVSAPGVESDRAVEQSELAACVFEAVAELSESRRVPVRMHLLGYESREIAARLGWSGSKTRNLLSRGMADLRERLRVRGIGPEGLA